MQPIHTSNFPIESSLEKTKFSPASKYLLELPSGTGMGHVCTFFNSSLKEPICHRPMQSLYMLPLSLWVHMYLRPVLFRTPCYLGDLHPFCLLYSFLLPLPRAFPNPEGRDLMEFSDLWLSVPSSLSVCVISSCLSMGLCVSFSLLQKENFFDGLSKALTYEYSRRSLGVISLLHCFSRSRVFGFTLGPRTI